MKKYVALNFKLLTRSMIFSFLMIFSLGCGADELVDLALDPPERKPINISKTGVNNFFVDPEFGSIAEQFLEIRDRLGLRTVRILFAWTDGVQPSPDSPANYSFYDSIVASIPEGMEVSVVLAHAPQWMSNSGNWTTGGNPRATWVQRWLRPTISRYAGVGRIGSWEVWNEPDVSTLPGDSVLELNNPSNYLELLTLSSQSIRSLTPGKLVVIAATTSIQQNFPNNLDYNKALKELGAEALVDVWSVHYYGEQFENLVRDNGVADFLNNLSRPIWVTESGAQGPNNQLAYVEKTWPFLNEQVPGIQRFYYYQFGSKDPIDLNFGLRTTNAQFPISDLYVYLSNQ